MDELHDKTFDLGEWRVEPRLHRLTRGKEVRQVDLRTMDVLVCLADHAGQVVRRDDLVAAVWGQDTFVSENTVSQSVSRLRKALDDDWRQPRFVETISKTGYRLLVAPSAANGAGPAVEEEEAVAPTGPPRTVAVTTASAKRSKAPGLGLLAVVVLLVLTGATLLSRSKLFPRTEVRVDPLPVVTSIGDERNAKLSPDGGRVAYAWIGEGDDYDLYIHEIDSGNRVRLTDDPAHEDLPAFSPDGGVIAFARGAPAIGCGLFKKSILGGPEERLGDCTQPRSLDWSPDGRWLVFSNKSAPEEPYRIVLHDLESGEQRILTDPPQGTVGDRYAVFSPDSRQIALRRDEPGSNGLYVMSIRGGALRKVTNEGGANYRGHDWTPDGHEIVMASDRHGRMALWHLPVAGGEPRRIPLADLWVNYPSFSSRRNRMIYERVADVIDVWSLSLGEGSAVGEEVPEEVLLNVSSTRSEINPRISPDGKRLAFTSNRTGVFEIWTAARDGSDAIRHTSFEGALVSSPNWSPDSRHLVFDSDAEGHQKDLWIVASDSRTPRRLTTAGTEERSPTYSHDGRSIYFASNRSGSWQIWKMPSDGGEAVRVTQDGGFRALEGPEGAYLYYSKREEPGVWRRPLAGGEETRLVDAAHPFDWATWEVGALGIYFVARWPTYICLYRFSDDEVVRLFKPDREVSYSTPAMTLADGGRTLIFAKIRQSEDEIMMVDLGR